MSEKAPQPNPDGNVSYDENNKRFRIRGENQSGAPFFAQDKILSHYGYADRTTEEAALATEQTPVDPMQDEVESTPTTTNTDIHPYTAYQQRIEDAEKLRSQADELLGSDEVKELRKSHLKSKASEKLKAGTWEARMSEAAPYFEVVMAAREKQAKDRSYEFNTEENEAADALAELNRKATLSAARSESKQDDPQKAMFEPLTEDDYRYYKATLEEGEDNEDSEDNQTTNHDPQDGKPWTQPDPATANKDLPKPPAKNNEDAAAQRKAQNEEDAKKYPQVAKPPEAEDDSKEPSDSKDNTTVVAPVPVPERVEENEKKNSKWRRFVAIGAVALAALGFFSAGGDTLPKTLGEQPQDKTEVIDDTPEDAPGDAPEDEQVNPDDNNPSDDNGETLNTAAFEIEPGRGYTQEIQDLLPGYTPKQYEAAHDAAVAEFGSSYIVTEGGSYIDQGELRIAEPGTGHWQTPEVAHYLQDYLQSHS